MNLKVPLSIVWNHNHYAQILIWNEVPNTFCLLDPQECRQNEQEVKVQMRESSRPLIALRETKGGSSNKKDLLNTPGLHLQMTQKSLTKSNQNLWIIKFADVFIF